MDEVFQPAVALFYLEDCSYKEIAFILEVPIGTVKSRLARGIAQLREILLSDGSPAAHNVNGIAACPTADDPSAPSKILRLSAPALG
jgi:hypothetical protein